ncbi:MAG: tetratricopeptide repeat protein [Chloroflexi bacterium]|nr:tetratricopeptide repeat protein [Chloroflexota bacterium]
MPFPFTRQIGFTLAVFAAIAFFFPSLMSAYYLNQANARLAHAAALPAHARASELAQANAEIQNARSVGGDRALAPIPARLSLAHARELLYRGEATQAASAIENAPALARDSIAQFLAGDAAESSGDLGRAVQHWRAAEALDYFARNAHRAQDLHVWSEAEKFARIAAGIAPGIADAHYVLGDALSRQNSNNSEAMSELIRARELTDDKELVAAILSRQGEIFAEQHNYRAAMESYNQARVIAPLDARPRTGYALAQIEENPSEWASAVALLTDVVNDSPWYTDAYIQLARFAQARQDVGEAERWLRQGLEKNSHEPHLLFALGQFYARQKQVARARAEFNLALKFEKHPDDLQKIQRTLAELDGK